MLYCIVPRELETTETFGRPVSLYESNPNVTVIVDRRGSSGEPGTGFEDRRRPAPGGVFLTATVEVEGSSPRRELEDRLDPSRAVTLRGLPAA